MNVAFPFAVDGRGRTASCGEARHVRDLLEMLLFTAPTERVMRPTFGTGILRLVFGAAPEAAAATRLLVEGALQELLGDVIAVESVRAEADEGTLTVSVAYRIHATGERRTETLQGRP